MARILIADDEEGVRTYLAEALERDGHVVTAVSDGDKAARLLDQHGWDLLLTDLRMPGMDGLALLQKIRDEQPEVEVVVLTAFGTVETAVAAMKGGAFDYVSKPIGSPAELRLVVSRALEHRTLLNWKASGSRFGQDPVMDGTSPAMQPVVSMLRKVAPTNATVLLLGESGTGKEVAARAVHRWSARGDLPFVAVSCAALSDELLESELFGHEKGAFTGATSQKRGRLELAQGGTFFLDEVGELKSGLQAKLLRVIQERRFERVGGTRTLEADVRWIAATNRDLKAMTGEGTFREDLYHRLAVFPIRLPALRERREDIRPLAVILLARIGEDLARPGLRLTPAAVERLHRHDWPGNVRELRNTLERAAILADGREIDVRHIALDAPREGQDRRLPDKTLEEIERMAIEQAVADEEGNRKRAAEKLGIGLRTLYEKLKKFEDPSSS